MAFRTSRPTAVLELAASSLALTPGIRLRAVVEGTLLDLRGLTDDEQDSIRRANDDLHGVLAYTAAVGETCLVAPAVEAVHIAEQCLVDCLLPQACAALTEALGYLAAQSRGGLD